MGFSLSIRSTSIRLSIPNSVEAAIALFSEKMDSDDAVLDPQSSASLRFAKTRSRPPERHRPTLTPVRARFGDQWRAPDRDRPFWFGGLDRSLGGPRNGWGWRRRRRSQKNGRWDGRFLQRLNSRCQRLDLIRHAFQIVLLRADVTVDLSNLITCLLLRGPNLQECLPVFR